MPPSHFAQDCGARPFGSAMVGRTSLRRRRWAGSARNGFRHAVVAAAPALAAGSATGLTAADACSRQRPRQTRTHTSKSAAPNPAQATTQEAQRPPRRRRQATGKPEKRSRVRFLPSAAGGPPTSRAPQSAEWVRTTSQSPSRRTALRTGFRRSFRYAMRSGFVLASHHVVEALAAPASVRPTSFYSRHTQRARHQHAFSFRGSRGWSFASLRNFLGGVGHQGNTVGLEMHGRQICPQSSSLVIAGASRDLVFASIIVLVSSVCIPFGAFISASTARRRQRREHEPRDSNR